MKFQHLIKVPTLIKLCAYIQELTTNLERDELISRLTTHEIDEEDLELIVKYMYLNEVVTVEQQER